MMTEYPCAMVKLAEGPNRTWSVPRIVVEAYIKVVQDFPRLHDVWIADDDVLRLLHARYDFAGSGKVNLKVKSINKYFAEIGPVRLGRNFANYPELNILGHYQIFRNVKPHEPKAFYYASSKQYINAVPVLDRKEPENGFELDKMVLDSDICCSSLLKTMERSTTDDVALQLALMELPKPPVVKKRPAPKRKKEVENDGRPRVRQKPGPKPKPKPPPAPKVCRGWSASKYNPLIRHSLIAFLASLPPESEVLIPELFPLIGPKDFCVVYNKQGEPTFCIYCTKHDPFNCELDSRSYKHCTACLKASGRLRTYVYLKGKNEKQQHTEHHEDEDESNDNRVEYPNHYSGASLDYGLTLSEF